MDCTNHHHASPDPGRSGTARRPTQHLLPRAHRMLSSLALLVLATMSATLPASEPVPRRTLPTGAELLESRHEWLRPSYFSCMDSAGSVEAREACVDEEFAYHDGELNRIYREKLATLSPRDQGVLREMEQDWISQIYDRRCRMPEQPTAAQRLDIRQCLTAATISRRRELTESGFIARNIQNRLNPRKPGNPEERETPALGDFGLPDSDGNLELQLGDIRIRGRLEDCEGTVKRYCAVRSLTVATRHGEQSFKPPQLAFLDAADPRFGFDVTAYRGELSAGFVSMLPTFIVYDLNSDGHEDLMLWTDFYGSYGDPSYTYYLFDPIHRAFVEAPALAKATHGFTLSRIRLNQMDLWYRDGPCLRGEKVLEIRGTTPVEISSTDYNTCERSNDAEERNTPTSGVFGLPGQEGRIDLQVSAVRVRAAIFDCKGKARVTCQVESLTLDTRWGEQTLDLPQLVFLDAVSPGSEVLDDLANTSSTFVVHDINDDGHEDLMLWTGSLGNYFSPSYSYYLFDPTTKQFVENHALDETTRGYTVARIRSNQIDLEYLIGACVHGEMVVAVEGTTPVEVSRHETETCSRGYEPDR